MHHKLAILAERRQKLILQAAEQRAMLAQGVESLRKPFAIADRGLRIIRYIKQNPLLMLGTTALLGIIRPIRYSKWFHVGWLAFKLARNTRKWLADR